MGRAETKCRRYWSTRRGPHEEVGYCQGTAGENQDQDDQKESKGQARRARVRQGDQGRVAKG